MTDKHSWRRRLIAILGVVAFAATACGGSGPSANSAAEVEARTAAEANQNTLTISDDLSQTELLNASTGEAQTLSDVVTGDRAVLLWYWAPH